MGHIRQMTAIFFSAMMLILSAASAEAGAFFPPTLLKDTDFAYRGVALGDTEARLLAVYGEPLFDKIVQKQGMTLKVYTFRGHIDVGVSMRTKRVVDFATGGDAFTARDGIKKGATKHKIWTTYGKVGRRFLDGKLAYVYTRPDHPHDHLVLFLDAETESLQSVRLTSLPLTEEEADEMAAEEEAESEALPAMEDGIDVSALPSSGQVRLGGVLP